MFSLQSNTGKPDRFPSDPVAPGGIGCHGPVAISMWTQAAGLRDLGTLGGNYSYARAISKDGSTIVGHSARVENSSYRAFRWTEATGMQQERLIWRPCRLVRAGRSPSAGCWVLIARKSMTPP